jgi:NAD(P)H-dependent FMN reductase
MSKKIITLGGSNSKASISKQLAEYVGNLIKNVEIINIDLNNYELPIFSVDIEEEEGVPQTAKELNSIIESADGFVIALAEHNGAYSVAFKNAFDWLSRIEGAVWRNKPLILLATSPGERGGATVLEIAKSRFPYNGGNIISSMIFPSFSKNFKNGKITNKKLEKNVIEMVQILQNNI